MRGSTILTALAISAAAIALPAAAQDVKAGVDAWGRGDYKVAVEQWRGPAVAGDADAQFNLGQAYKLGRGVPTDPGMAESWFRKAAMQGHVQAEDNYGLALFQAGKQTDAVPWLEKSVARGEPRARLVLGTMLFNGDGVPRNLPRAYALMTLASQSGLQSASTTLAQMDQFISSADRERGTKLAQQYATQDRALAAAPPPARIVEKGPTPVRAPVQPKPMAQPEPATTKPVSAKPEPIKVAAEKPAASKPAPVSTKPAPAAPKPTPVAKPTAEPAGRWRIQLGAFRDRGNAESLWRSIGSRTGASAIYTPGGGVTRLQAGPYASKVAAQKACAAVKATCVVVAP